VTLDAAIGAALSTEATTRKRAAGAAAGPWAALDAALAEFGAGPDPPSV
jgi:hypothetical protein